VGRGVEGLNSSGLDKSSDFPCEIPYQIYIIPMNKADNLLPPESNEIKKAI